MKRFTELIAEEVAAKVAAGHEVTTVDLKTERMRDLLAQYLPEV